MHDLTVTNWAVLLIAVFTVAFFYSSVGHGGATGYLAALALLGVAPAPARVAVLIANVCVASIAWFQFWRAGHFDWRVLVSFAVASIPCAWFGARVPISPQVYKIILGSVLFVAGLILLFRSRWQTDDVQLHKFLLPVALLIGGVLGFLAGLTGIGGGVFLSPLLYVFRWVKPKTTGGIAAGFIVVNSIAGLAGVGWQRVTHAGPLLWFTVPAVIGAVCGTHLGSRRWTSVTFSRVLAGVLVFSGGKLLYEALLK
ncbi:MAG TPA: sulfite exporter TauE/SafE family protein [Verrucomicrobiae bacterium]|nr:sulfite exporter TauE/SafE family protein [Verrucomicrobiae bacterium]